MSAEAPSAATQAARLLVAVRRGAPRLPALPVAVAPQTLEAAYAIQHEVLRELGGRVAGWKATLFDARHGICAPLAAHSIIDAPAYFMTYRAATAHTTRFGVEPEIAFRVGEDLPPLAAGQRYEREQVCTALVSAHAAVEIVTSRYADGDSVTQLERVADLFMNEALVVGLSVPGWRDLAIADLELEVRIDGVCLFRGRGGHPLSDPLLPVLWLANHLSGRGQGLRAGDLVTTGSCNGVRLLAPGQHYSAYFVGLGASMVTF